MSLKTNAVMQNALINAGLVTEERAQRFNTIQKEEKRKAQQRKKAAQAKKAAEAHARFNRPRRAA